MWVGQVAQSVQRLATGCTVRGSNCGGGEIFRTCPDRSLDPPTLLHKGFRVIPGSKEPVPWRWPPTPSSAEVKESVKLYIYSPCGHSWPVIRWTLPLNIPSAWPTPTLLKEPQISHKFLSLCRHNSWRQIILNWITFWNNMKLNWFAI